MAASWRARDLDLLDALDSLPRAAFEGPAWRAVRRGRDPLLGHPSAGRWDPGTFDVLYTSLESNGAIAELHFQLSRQPVFPSIEFALHELHVRTRRTLTFADLSELELLGVERDRYDGLFYRRTQEIADAAAFLGFDGVMAPSARWPCPNLVIFSHAEHLRPGDLRSTSESAIDWAAWRARLPKR